MKKHLFLSVSSGGAGEMLIRDTLGPLLSMAGGLVTMRASAPNEALRVALMPAAAAGGVEGFDRPIILDCSAGTARKDNEVYRSLGVRLLQEAVYYPFAVLDRIGGYELVIPQFRQALADLLSSDLPLLGTLMSRSDAVSLGQSLGLGERYLLLNDRLHEALAEDEDTLVLDAETCGEEAARRIVMEWVKEYVY